jgi:hypothetical protein
MLAALEARREKLSVYYQLTEEAHSSLYAMGTILAPQYKLKFLKAQISQVRFSSMIPFPPSMIYTSLRFMAILKTIRNISQTGKYQLQ